MASMAPMAAVRGASLAPRFESITSLSGAVSGCTYTTSPPCFLASRAAIVFNG